MSHLKDRLTWHDGGIFDADRRYLMLRADVLMGVVRQLPAELQATVLAAMADSVAANGGKSAQAYFEAIGRDPATLLQVMVESSADLGWGQWQFVGLNHAPLDPTHLQAGLALQVQHSPFAAGHGPASQPVCAPIVGMLRAVGSLLLGQATVAETHCAAQGHTHCRFEIRA